MIRDITIGQYYNVESSVHKLDPRVKLFGTFIYVLSLFLCKNTYFCLYSVFVLALIIVISKVDIRYILRGIKPIVFVIVFTGITNVLFIDGEEIIFNWKFITIYEDGIKNAILFCIRLLEIIIGTSLMTYTTTPTSLMDGLEKTFSPLTKIHIPIHEIALMMSVTLRFIPIFIEELNRIMRAQTARGIDFEKGNIIKRMKIYAGLLIPLFSSVLKRANELAVAMETRCYRAGAGRSKMKPLKYGINDMIGYIFILMYLFVALYIIKKIGTFAFECSFT